MNVAPQGHLNLVTKNKSDILDIHFNFIKIQFPNCRIFYFYYSPMKCSPLAILYTIDGVDGLREKPCIYYNKQILCFSVNMCRPIFHQNSKPNNLILIYLLLFFSYSISSSVLASATPSHLQDICIITNI